MSPWIAKGVSRGIIGVALEMIAISLVVGVVSFKHYADAAIASVALTQADGHLPFAVSDDGRGFDPRATGYGTGLQGIADRLDAIGGSLTVTSTPGAGTTVSGRLRIRALEMKAGS